MNRVSNTAFSSATTIRSVTGAPPLKAVNKEQELRGLMRQMGKVLVAYSGGVDSSYLAHIASQELGGSALCVMGLSPSVAAVQRHEAAKFAAEAGFNFHTIDTAEIADKQYTANPVNRCYYCKSELYSKLRLLADQRQITFVLDGTNADDLRDERPGRIAAGELQIRSPLADVGLTKSEIRELSRRAGIRNWDKPSSPCLSSRIAYGIPVTIERLSRIERGEDFLRDLGFREFRVRVHGDLARIEIAPNEMERAMNEEFAALTVARFSELGFKYVTLDLKGFRSGSMNEIIHQQ